MTISPGNSLQSRSSSATEASVLSLYGGLGLCVVFGIVAALVDLYLRLPLHLPGWRGLITMALLVAARRLSGRAWAASATAFAASVTALALGMPPRFGTLAFLVPGLVVDALCRLRPNSQANKFLDGVAAGFGNLAKFAVSFLAVAALGAHGGMANGWLPWVSHFGFGFCGGLFAALVTSMSHRSASGAAR